MIQLAITDDHDLFLKGLKSLLDLEPNLKINHTFTTGTALLESLESLDVDLLLLDVQLPDISAEDLLQEIRIIRPNIPILYLTMIRGSRVFKKLSKNGIQGYILKDASLNILKTAIETVASGQIYFASDIEYSEQNEQANTVTTPENRLQELLSPREYEVLIHICQEFSNSEIAKKLFLSVGTVDTHRKNMLVKLGLKNTVGLIKFAMRNGLE
ncbi:MAG: two-component system response regulator NreC [Arcticibacterium sp.]|jgi:two-component system response regulator NreC